MNDLRFLPFRCPNCNGYGTVTKERVKCHTCNGKGMVVVDQETGKPIDDSVDNELHQDF
jgi:DnaJ-class molecular chaperone